MLRTLKHFKNIRGKRVLLRVDFNVPVGRRGITDDTRIRETLPTIKHLLHKKAKLIIITHLGRPEGRRVKALMLDPVAARLGKLLKKRVQKLPVSVGRGAQAAVKKMKDGEALMLENIRFHPGEESCKPAFVKTLAGLGDAFVNDAFAVSHRKHASVYGVAKRLPAYAGFLLEREVRFMAPLLAQIRRPFTLIVGGAKVDTKIGLLKHYFGKADAILIGGALANTFLAAQGYDIGQSLFEREKIETARELLLLAEKQDQKILLPSDVVVADEIAARAKTADLPLEDVEGSMRILDIGAQTAARYARIIKNSKTILWNGPMGLYEFTPFASGTKKVARTIAGLKGKAKSYLGGGDTIDALKRSSVSAKKFTFVSTGGGAMLEFLEGRKLPGIEVLKF